MNFKKFSGLTPELGELLACVCLGAFSFAHKAVADGPWNAAAQFSSIQGANQWYYQQRPQGGGTATNLSWISTGGYSDPIYGSTGYYKTSETNFGWLYWYTTHPGQSNDTIRKWVAPSSGTISITGQVFKVATSGGAGVIATVEKNGTPIWSKTVAYNDSNGYRTDADLGSVPINSGDSIAFVIDDNGSWAADETQWNPTITKITSYDAYADFSSIQGTHQWYYQQRPQGGGSVTNMSFPLGDIVYRTTDGGQTGWLGNYLGIATGHPGNAIDVIRKWVAPSAGTVSVTGRIYKVNTGGGGGVIASVEKNGTPIWSRTLAYNDAVGYTTDAGLGAVSVASGDSLAFIVDDNGVYAYDQFGWDPVITSPSPYWVTAWGCPMEGVDSSVTASNFSTRNIVRVTLPGSAIRIRLSNIFGAAAITVQQAFVGPHTTGANVSSNTQIYFGGNASVTIQPGHEVTSDQVNLSVTQQEDLGVSLYFSSLNGAGETLQHASYSTQYLTKMDGTGGNHAAATTDGNTYFASNNNAGFTTANSPANVGWLDAVDVLTNDSATSAVVCLGDSITNGDDITTLDTFNRWTDILEQRMASNSPAPLKRSIVNEGIAGNAVLSSYLFSSITGPSAILRLGTDVLGNSGVKYCIILEGTNDIATGTSASDLEAGLTTIVNQLHAQYSPITVICATILPRGTSWSSSLNSIRDSVNTWIRTSGIFNAVIDFDPVMEDPSHTENLLPAYDSGDGLHPNAAGHAAMGDAISLSLF